MKKENEVSTSEAINSQPVIKEKDASQLSVKEVTGEEFAPEVSKQQAGCGNCPRDYNI